MKLYNQNNLWVDTKPLVIENNELLDTNMENININLESNLSLLFFEGITLFKNLNPSIKYFIKNILYLSSKKLFSLIKYISFYNTFKLFSSLTFSLLLIYKIDLLQNSINTLFSLCLGMRSELILLSDTIPILSVQINAVNANINSALLTINNNFQILNTHLYYQDAILNNLYHNNVWSQSSEEINNMMTLQSPNSINTDIVNTWSTYYPNNFETNVIINNPGLNLNINPNPMNIFRIPNNMNSNIIHNFNPNIINNINPLIFGKMINFNNAQGRDFIHHNNMIINNAMDIIII